MFSDSKKWIYIRFLCPITGENIETGEGLLNVG
jgi:hypothetical protein